MRELKKLGIIIGTIVFITLSIAGCSFFLIGIKEDPMEKYMKDKYQVEIEIVEEQAKNTGNMGDVWNKVVLKNNKNVQFGIHVTGLFLTNYKTQIQ